MNRNKQILTFIISAILALPYTAAAQTNSLITPVVTILPATFPINERCNTLVVISNGNPASSKSLQTGDAFKVSFTSVSDLQLESPVLLNSSTDCTGFRWSLHLVGKLLRQYHNETLTALQSLTS